MLDHESREHRPRASGAGILAGSTVKDDKSDPVGFINRGAWCINETCAREA